MRSRRTEWIIIIAIFLLILALTVFAVRQQDRDIRPARTGDIEFTGADRQYLQEHDQIDIYVSEDLQFLIGDAKGGYLPDYLGEALEPAGLAPHFLTDASAAEDADCVLRVVTPGVRSDMEGRSYTAPLFQVEGRLFVNEAQKLADPGMVYVQADRLSAKKLQELTWHDQPLHYETKDTLDQLLETAGQGTCFGLIADRCAMEAALRQAGLQQEYVSEEKTLYLYNGCIIVDDDNTAVYDILNQCIQACDRHALSYECSERWLGGGGPVYMSRSRGDSYLPVLIIILSVLIAFFVYYVMNRTMYQELSDRMDKITESRNEMETTFHGVGHYMAELTAGGVITDLNRALAEDLDAPALQRRIWEVLDLDEDGREQIRRMVEDGARGIQAPRYETSIGKQTFVIDIFPVEDARGEVGQLLFMAIDVTQERMAKRQMLQDNKMIAIGQLAAGVAHEIRNPLGIIRNYCYVLKTMEDEEIRAKAIAEIEKAVETSGGIINNLLDFSRISPGRVERIDVEEHIRSLLLLNESSFRSKNIDLVIECPQPINTFMAMEPFDMILLNLVKNAMDAIDAAEEAGAFAADAADAKAGDAAGTAAGDGPVAAAAAAGLPAGMAGRVTVTVERAADRDDMFDISVADTGVGIDRDALEEIFNPFYTTKGNQGTGLGLYIVYSETEKLGGDIEVSSRKGEGTTFRLRLPIREDDGRGARSSDESGSSADDRDNEGK